MTERAYELHAIRYATNPRRRRGENLIHLAVSKPPRRMTRTRAVSPHARSAAAGAVALHSTRHCGRRFDHRPLSRASDESNHLPQPQWAIRPRIGRGVDREHNRAPGT